MTLSHQTTPHFSIVVPVYNASATIEETIASVREQEVTDFELILIDDGSTDDSLSKMLRLACQDQRIRLISQDNGGVSEARNQGIAMARGELVAFLDADDIWHPEKLSMHRSAHAADTELVASYAQIVFLEADEGPHPRGHTTSTVPDGPLTIRQIIGENPVCTTSNLVVRRDALERIGGFESGMDYAEDQEWLARAVSLGARIMGLPPLLVGYRLSPDGLSVNLDAMYDGWRTLAHAYADGEDLAAAEALYCRYLARRALRSGANAAAARRYALRGLALDHQAFLADVKRGGATLAAAIAAPLIPAPVRRRVFA